jgi:hypothetical protein
MFNWKWESNADKEKLAIAYLFLSSEERINDTLFQMFEEIGISIKKFPDIKGEVIGECEKILASPDSNKSRFETVSEVYSTYKLPETPSDKFLFSHQKLKWENKTGISFESFNRSVLLTLTSLQFLTITKSAKKQQLIELWAETNLIDKSVILEMYDTCETEHHISKYKIWLESTKGMPYQEVNSSIQELGKNLKSLEQSVSDLIALG